MQQTSTTPSWRRRSKTCQNSIDKSASRQVGQCLSRLESSLRRAVHFSNQSHSTCATMTTSRDQGFYGNQKYGIDMDTKWIQMAERSERCNAATKVYTDIYIYSTVYIYMIANYCLKGGPRNTERMKIGLYAATIAVSNHQGKSKVSGLAEDDGKMRLPHTSWTSWIDATCNPYQTGPTYLDIYGPYWTMHTSHFPIKGKPANPFDTRCFRLTRYRRCWSLPASPLHPERTIGKEATRS